MTEQKKVELLSEVEDLKDRYGLRAVCFCATDPETGNFLGVFGVNCKYMDAELFEAAFNAARLYQSAREKILAPTV